MLALCHLGQLISPDKNTEAMLISLFCPLSRKIDGSLVGSAEHTVKVRLHPPVFVSRKRPEWEP